MITGRDFIFTGLQPWDMSIGSNARDIAKEVAKTNRVLYINTPLDVINLWKNNPSPDLQHRKDVLSKKTGTIRQIEENLWVIDYPFSILPCNFLPDGIIFDFVNRLNQKRMYSYIQKVIDQLHFSNYILFTDNDIYRSFYATEYLSPALSVYYRRDNLISPFWQKHAPRLEPQICRKNDLVVTNSIQLAEAIKAYNAHCYDIGQGVDLTNYNININYPLPQDMEGIKRPIIGYMGCIITLRLDADLLYEVAVDSPEHSFVLVGGEDDFFKSHPLHTLKNVHFLGEKPQKETVNYMAHFDVCINPQRINEVTIGNYPRKIDEYLALGKPVVATRTDTMQIFEDHVWNCMGKEEYIHAIHQALTEIGNPKKQEERIAFAHTHSWVNSVNKLYKAILDTNQFKTNKQS